MLELRRVAGHPEVAGMKVTSGTLGLVLDGMLITQLCLVCEKSAIHLWQVCFSDVMLQQSIKNNAIRDWGFSVHGRVPA